MQLSELARKQKRLIDWMEFTNTEVGNPELKTKVLTTLAEFGRVLTHCWQQKEISPEMAAKISDYERRLEQLNDDVRLQVKGRPSGMAH